MTTIDHDDEPAFARGIAGPLGKVTAELKTKVDQATDEVFRRQCALSKTDTATVLRDFVYLFSYGKTYTQMVAEKAVHDGKRIEAMLQLIGPFGAPESQGGAGA